MNSIRKRSRSISSQESNESSSSIQSTSNSITTNSPKSKLTKTTINSDSIELICSLKPTCSKVNSIFKDSESLNNHRLTFHTFVCNFKENKQQQDNLNSKGKGRSLNHNEEKLGECGRIFPSERFLQLHMKEIHDPSFKLEQEQELKIFECLLPPNLCQSKFRTPKKRRLHLIQKHQFPKEYYFDITLWGLAGISKKGIGNGLIRDVWTGDKNEVSVDQTEMKEVEEILEDRGLNSTRELPPHSTPSTTFVITETILESPLTILEDSTMDDLTNSFASTKIKLDLLPRAVRLANKAKEKKKEQMEVSGV